MACLSASDPALAQGGTATILGSITDPSGAVIPNATINVKNADTGITQTVQSNAQGRYTVPQLVIGSYTVTVSAPGFATTVQSGIQLNVGSQTVVNLALQVGQAQQTVAVQGQAVQVETASTSISDLVAPTQMRELPLNGRDFEQLLTLAPGVVQRPANPGIYGSQGLYSIAGARGEGQAYLIDNTDVQDFWSRGTGSGALGTTLGIDSIAEFQILTNTYSAQYGGSGSVLNATTKSGTNSFHGSLYEFIRNNALDARNYFDPTKASLRPAFRRNQFGATLGGPIKRDKAFFFANYESVRQVFGQSFTADVPDAAARQGYLPNGHGSLVPANPGCPAYSPSLPQFTCVAANMQSTLALYPVAPAANELLVNGQPSGIATLTQKGAQDGIENYGVMRVDYNFSEKDSAFVRYEADNANLTQYPVGDIPLWPELDATYNQYATLQEKRLISSNLVNLAQFAYVRTSEIDAVQPATPALQFFATAPRNGTVITTGWSELGGDTLTPTQLIQNRFTPSDDVILTHGAHNITFGVSLERIQDNSYSKQNIGGSWIFTSPSGFLTGTAFSLVAPIPGETNADRDLRELILQTYFNDSWRVSNKLTLNMGVRWEPAVNPVDATNSIYQLPQTPLGINGAINTASPLAFTHEQHPFASNPSWYNIDPRVGFAFDPYSDNKTVIRGGFGLFHDVILARQILPGLWFNPPFTLGRASFPTYGPNPTSLKAAPITQTEGTSYQTASTPVAIQYNLNLQREISSNTVFTLAYVGSLGRNLFIMADLNPPVNLGTKTVPILGHGTACIGPNTPVKCSDQATPNPSLQSGVAIAGNPLSNLATPLDERYPSGNAHYNSLQAVLNRRFTNNLQFQASYTWSKSMDYGSQSSALEDTGAAAQQIQNPYDARQDYGRSTFDLNQDFVANAVYQLPFKANRLVEGWQLTGIFSATSAQPFTVFDGFDRAGTNDTNERPDVIPGCNTILHKVSGFYNTSCLTLPPLGQLGTMQRDSLNGPAYTDADIALMKDTAFPEISEAFNVQFRVETFDTLNHPNFAFPNQSAFSLAPGGNAVTNGAAGTITLTRGNEVVGGAQRVIQFGLKILF